VGHLGIVLIGSSLIPFNLIPDFLSPALATYAAWTGAGHGYSFFSPNPGFQIIAEASWRNSENGEIETEYFGLGGDEFQRRISSTLTNFVNARVYDLGGRTVAAWVIGRNRDTCQDVIVRFVEIIPPPPASTTAPRREIRYQAVFTTQ
jgi:hypothetical protein